MNIIALISAIVGVCLMAATVHYGNKIKNRWLRYLAAIGGVLISLIVAGYIPSMLGDSSTSTASKSGEYLGYLIVGAVIIKFIFFRKKKPD